MNKKLINFIKTEENLTLETKITLFNPHVVQTDLIERNASRESIQIIRTENYTITRCIIKIMHRKLCFFYIKVKTRVSDTRFTDEFEPKWTVHRGQLNRPNNCWIIQSLKVHGPWNWTSVNREWESNGFKLGTSNTIKNRSLSSNRTKPDLEPVFR